MIWGASFSLLFVLLVGLSLLQFVLLRRYLRKNPPVCSLPVSVNYGEAFPLSLDLFLPILFPGFRVVWLLDLLWEKGGRSIRARISPSFKGNLQEYSIPSPDRGLYRGESGNLLLEDLFGLFSFSLHRGEPVNLYVYPKLNGGDADRERLVSGGKKATNDKQRIRTEDFLEVRKYYPGDDARRINWKLFAATGEMFLRIGEETPPPSGEALVSLFSDSPLVSNLSISSLLADRLVDGLLTLIRRFDESGCSVKVYIPGRRKPLLYEPANPDNLLKALSGVCATSEPPAIPDNDFFYAVAFPGAKSLSEMTEKPGGDVKVFLLSSPELREEESFLKILLYNKGSFYKMIKKSRELQSFSECFAYERDSLKKNGKGKVHVDVL